MTLVPHPLAFNPDFLGLSLVAPQEHLLKSCYDQLMQVPPELQAFWQAFLVTVPDPDEANSRFYEAFIIGDSKESADEGARLILDGEKTTTSMLLWALEDSNQPGYEIGSLHILKDGSDNPVAVIETMELSIKAFNEVDEQFAYDYGEWDRSLEGWRKACWAYYSKECKQLGKEASETMLLQCERFRVIYPAD